MCKRLALFASAIMFVGLCAFAQGDGQQSPDQPNQDLPGSASRECELELLVPVILRVGECVELDDSFQISVESNTRNRVTIDASDFVRNERDCDGNLLSTIDRIEADFEATFVEAAQCEEGAALEVRRESDGSWCVNPHRGGYIIQLSRAATSDEADICDDAGCYTATARVTVFAEPFEDCVTD